MKRISEYRDEAALDLLADLIEPFAVLAGDGDFSQAFRDGKRMKAMKIALKNHKREVMEILAAVEGVPLEEYHCNVLTVPMRLLEIVSDTDLIQVFASQALEISRSKPSGSATVNTGDGEN